MATVQHMARQQDAPLSPTITHGAITINGVEFAYLTAGDAGPLALCLHGFPDSAYGWRLLLPELAAAGYRAVAPFQRGYAPTAVPADGRYQTGMLSVDANAFHEALGNGKPGVIIGHDWGAPATHGAAVLAPERWSKVVSMAVPPGGAMGMAVPEASVVSFAGIERTFVVANGALDDRIVRVGRKLDGGRVEILEGLKEGESVVAKAGDRMAKGQKVRVR